MKKYAALLLAALIILSGSSCARTAPPGAASPSVPAVSPSAPPTAPAPPAPSDTPAAGPSAVTTAAEEFLAGEPDLDAVGAYLRQHAAGLEPGDGQRLLERLLLLQLDVSMELNVRLWERPYMTALNEILGGVLDPDKIGDIPDEAVRADFQMLADGFMTIVRYEETPAVETDWKALNDLAHAFNLQTGMMLELQSHLRGGYYGGSDSGLDLMAEDIAAIEKELYAADTGFVSRQLKKLYSRLVATLLFGPEGQYLSDFADGREETLSRVERYSAQYGGTRFGQICGKLLDIRASHSDDLQAMTDMIITETAFGPDEENRLALITKKSEYGATLVYPAVYGDGDQDVYKKINAAVENAAMALLRPTASLQDIGSYETVSGSFISVTLSSSYEDEAGWGYEEKHITFDLDTGTPVTLDDLTGKPFEDYRDDLISAVYGETVPESLSSPVDFALSGDGLMLYVVQEGVHYVDYYEVTLNGLRRFMDVSKLY